MGGDPPYYIPYGGGDPSLNVPLSVVDNVTPPYPVDLLVGPDIMVGLWRLFGGACAWGKNEKSKLKQQGITTSLGGPM